MFNIGGQLDFACRDKEVVKKWVRGVNKMVRENEEIVNEVLTVWKDEEEDSDMDEEMYEEEDGFADLRRAASHLV